MLCVFISHLFTLQDLLQDVVDVDKELLQIETLKDSVTASSTAKASASFSQQVDNLKNHKRALDSSIRENLALLRDNGNQRAHQVEEEVSCVQTALKDLAENVSNLCENRGVLPDISQLKVQWNTIQVLFKDPMKYCFSLSKSLTS